MAAAEPVSVLMTCVGGALAVEFINAFKATEDVSVRVVGVDTDARAAGRAFVDAFYQVPAGSDPGFIEAVLEICRREQIRVVTAGADEEVEAIAAARDRFEACGVRCAVPAYDTVRLLRDKGALLAFLQRADIVMPAWRVVRTPEQLQAAIEALGYPARPLVIKPCTARGGRGIVELHESEDPWVSMLSGRDGLRLRARDLLTLLGQRPAFAPLLVMDYLPGPAYDVDILARAGEALCVTIRRRYNPRGVPFRGCVTEANDRIEEKVIAAVSALRLDYCCDIDMAFSSEGEPHILEINPRMSGSVIGSIPAGINYLGEIVRMALGLPVTKRAGRPGVETLPHLAVRHTDLAERGPRTVPSMADRR